MEKSSKQVIIIPLRKSMITLARGVRGDDSLCYYLADNYSYFIELQQKHLGSIRIKNLCGIFDKTFQELKEPILECFSNLNKRYGSYSWWGGMLASKSCTASSLLPNITYLFCAKKILSQKFSSIVFIVDSPALFSCIANIAKDQGFEVKEYRNKFYKYGESFKHFVRYFLQIGSFSLKVIQNYIVSLKIPKPTLNPRVGTQKRIVIRSWFTRNKFDNSSQFEDRNFGCLPQWLQAKGHDVWMLPMFFNISMNAMQATYAHLRHNAQAYLMPEHYLQFSDYVCSFLNGYKVFRQNIKGLKIQGVEVSLLFNETLKKQGFDVSLCMLNLSCQVLKRLKQLGFGIDGFYYAFENNAPEKQFILSCRKYYPKAKIIGFQHSVFFPNQLAVSMAADEKHYHPLPDKIICSGPVYRNLYEKERFPKEILADGPNLRFQPAHLDGKDPSFKRFRVPAKNILLPLTFNLDLAFELIWKIKETLKDVEGYCVCIRTHPLLSKKALEKYLERINFQDYIFADEGSMHEWLCKTCAVVSTGGTIAVLEAVCLGTPVIRVIPDNTFHYDVLTISNYPLKPVSTSLEIKEQLILINNIYESGDGVFARVAKEVLNNYFRAPDEENLKVFLDPSPRV